MSRIRTFIADGQAVFRQGIFIAPSSQEDIEVIGATRLGEDAYTFLWANPPDIAILYMGVQKPGGAEITRLARNEWSSIRFISILDTADDENVFQVLKRGASAYITRDCSPKDLADLVREVYRGEKPIYHSLNPAVRARAFQELNYLPPSLENDINAPELSTRPARAFSFSVGFSWLLSSYLIHFSITAVQ